MECNSCLAVEAREQQERELDSNSGEGWCGCVGVTKTPKQHRRKQSKTFRARRGPRNRLAFPEQASQGIGIEEWHAVEVVWVRSAVLCFVCWLLFGPFPTRPSKDGTWYHGKTHCDLQYLVKGFSHSERWVVGEAAPLAREGALASNLAVPLGFPHA